MKIDNPVLTFQELLVSFLPQRFDGGWVSSSFLIAIRASIIVNGILPDGDALQRSFPGHITSSLG